MARVDHVDDGRVIERCDELTFPEKTVAPCGAMFVDAEELDGYLLLNLPIGSLGQIDCAHATGAEQSYESVWSATPRFPSIGATKQLFGSMRHATCQVLLAGRVKAQ